MLALESPLEREMNVSGLVVRGGQGQRLSLPSPITVFFDVPSPAPMDRGAWRNMVHRVAELDVTEAT